MVSEQRPLISIVSVFHNRVGLVDQCVRSLLAQDYSPLEILIYDDGSTDGTAEALSAYDDPRLKVITQPNAGFTVTLNRAIRSATGDVIALHGSGDIALPERMSKQIEALMSSDDVGLVGCITDRSHGRVGPQAKTNRQLSGNIHKKALKGGLVFTHGAAMFRKSLFHKIGGYREFFQMAQGRDFYLRIPNHLDYIIIPESLYIKITPPDSIGASARKIILQRYLTEFAVQCAQARDRGEDDPLEKYGSQAAFQRAQSQAVALPLLATGLRWLTFGDEAGGRLLITAAAGEGLSVKAVIGKLLVEASRRPQLWRLVRPTAQRLFARRAASGDAN